MKKFFLLFLISLLPLFAQTSKSGSKYCADNKTKSEKTFVSNNMLAIPHSFDVLNYKLDLNLYSNFISPYPKSFTGSVTITFKVDTALNFINLNAVNTSLTIDSVKNAGVSFTHTSNILKIFLDRTYNPGEETSVKIYYKHNNVTDNAYNVSNGMVFTDCEPEGARKWFPCFDKPSDKATLDLTAKVPATVKLGSNGRLADSVKNQDTIYYRWISADPVPTYLVVISAKVNYNLDIVYWQRPSNPSVYVPIRFYWNAGESTADLNAMKTAVPQMMTKYSELFTEHPFEKNGFATLNNLFTWGGMENQTLTSLCPNCWDEMLLAHEFAHQWFGDMITCETWADIWVNEGFATYTESLWLEATQGYSAYKSDVNSNASGYLSSNPGWAISVPSWAVTTPNSNTLFNYAITYQKGAAVHHLLRYTIGDSLYFKTLKEYANDPQLKYNSATIRKFNDKVNLVTNNNYDWFFDQWIFQANHPVYGNKYYFEQVGTSWTVGFVAQQNQTNAGFFKMPIEIKINFNNGTDTTVKVMNTTNGQLFTFSFNKQPSSIQFDPSNNIVLKTATLTQIPPLPVELSSFTAEARNNFVVLNWRTETELNNRGFEILRGKANSNGKADESSFRVVTFIDGNGTTTSAKEYTYSDYIGEYGNYVYRLKQIDFDGSVNLSNEVFVTSGVKPESFKLFNNYPNPFNPSTVIAFQMPKAAFVSINIYNTLGQRIKTLISGNFEAGIHKVEFDASEYTSGVYIYELMSEGVSLKEKMVLQK